MLKKTFETFRNMLITSLTPYKPLLDKAGIQITAYEENDDETNTVIIGVKIIFLNPEAYSKFKGGKL